MTDFHVVDIVGSDRIRFEKNKSWAGVEALSERLVLSHRGIMGTYFST